MSWARALRSFKWRKWLRTIHRDVGYLAVGLTFVYAVSGIAINHIDDWDPNFEQVDETYRLPAEATIGTWDPTDPDASQGAAREILKALARDETPLDVYAIDSQHLDITLEHSTLYVDRERREIREEGQSPRPGLRLANWLHLNRGKKAWTYIADGYAVLLLYLATSGLFMLRGRQGLWGRGAVLALVGAAVPILYVTLSGGP